MRRKASANSARNAQPAPGPAGDRLLNEAEALQQRAERKRGADAVPAFEEAARKYQDAIDAGAARTVECFFGLGECLQMQGDAVMGSCQKLPDQQLTPAVEQQAAATAIALYQRAVEAYQRVVEPSGVVRVDAAVNCGNTLAALGELQQGGGLEAYRNAVGAYEAALALEHDALTLSNLGDVLMQLAEGLHEAGQADETAACVQRALSTYQTSCSLTDSASGDDLPGLLHNWGVGLHTAASLTQDPSVKQHLLEESVRRLQSSVNFDRGDPAPLNALGDALVSAAEAAGSWQEAAGLYNRALQEGFQAALTLNRRNADALVGIGEVNAALGKLALQATGDPAAALSHFQQSFTSYKSALSDTTQLGSFKERCDVRYNYVCVCALCGMHQEAEEQLRLLTSWQAVDASELVADEDLSSLRGLPWFQQLVSQ